MTETSQNGWVINPPLKPLVVGGVTFGGVHTGDAYLVLQYVATRFHTAVEKLIAGQCGCYNPRKIPGTSVWSNHASATALDINWQRHPLGGRNTFNALQVAAIRRILADCDGVIRWGGDFHNVDEMHFEINTGTGAVSALARRIEDTDVTPAELLAYDPNNGEGVPNPFSDAADNKTISVKTALFNAVLIPKQIHDQQTALVATVEQLAATVADLAAAVDDIRTTLAGQAHPQG